MIRSTHESEGQLDGNKCPFNVIVVSRLVKKEEACSGANRINKKESKGK